jgi:hypothetical protein
MIRRQVKRRTLPHSVGPVCFPVCGFLPSTPSRCSRSFPGPVILSTSASALSPANTNSHDVTVFAAQRASGDYTFLVLNKADATHTLDLTLQSADLSGHEVVLTGLRYGKTQDEEQRLKSLQVPPVLSNNTRETFALARNGSALTYEAPPLSVTVLSLPRLPADPPEISSAEGHTGVIGQSFLHQLSATGGGVTFTATNLPDGLSFDATNARITGTPTAPGDFTIPITATNPQGSDHQTFRLSVRDRALATSYEEDFSGVHAWWSYQGDGGVSGALSTGSFGPDGSTALQHAVTVSVPTVHLLVCRRRHLSRHSPFRPVAVSPTFGEFTVQAQALVRPQQLGLCVRYQSQDRTTATRSPTAPPFPGQTWTAVEFPLSQAIDSGSQFRRVICRSCSSPQSATSGHCNRPATASTMSKSQRGVPQDTHACKHGGGNYFGGILPLGDAAETADAGSTTAQPTC